MRQACYSSKKMVVIAEFDYIDQILENWKGLSKEITPLENYYKVKKEGKDIITYVDYLEKLVLIDLMLDGFIHDNFIKYKVN